MEPMLPREGDKELENLALDLVAKSQALAVRLNPQLEKSIGDLVRSMNCYYSNLIEGHHTHPIEIEQALNDNYSINPEKRNLQLEARAHIEVQAYIDQAEISDEISSLQFICSIHKKFYDLLPDELKWVGSSSASKRKKVEAGKLRDGDVQVGQHIAPAASDLESLLLRYQEVYDFTSLSKLRSIIAVAAAHHRFVWIHPFYDGNGRVVRLLSHAYLKQLGIGSSIWSVSRALARNVQEYKTLLMAADGPRQGDYDGRGNLSEKALKDFCVFFLGAAIDQVEFMDSLLEPISFRERVSQHIQMEITKGALPRGSLALIKEVILRGEVERGTVAEIVDYSPRQARTILSKLLEYGILTSSSPRGAVRLCFPVKVLEYWFPRLYA